MAQFAKYSQTLLVALIRSPTASVVLRLFLSDILLAVGAALVSAASRVEGEYTFLTPVTSSVSGLVRELCVRHMTITTAIHMSLGRVPVRCFCSTFKQVATRFDSGMLRVSQLVTLCYVEIVLSYEDAIGTHLIAVVCKAWFYEGTNHD